MVEFARFNDNDTFFFLRVLVFIGKWFREDC